MDKRSIIEGLAIEMGKQTLLETKYGEKKYDPQTGTLYCAGKMINRNEMNEAKEYFRQQIALYKTKAEEGVLRASDLMLFYEAGLSGIEYLQEQGNKQHGNIIIKE